MNEYQICTRCVMDTTADPDITFDDFGHCNYCNSYFERENEHIVKGERGRRILENKIREIKESRLDRRWDCLVGVSGGADSSYVALLAKKYGLRAVLFHFDNGWDTEKAKQNIKRLVEYTGFELHTWKVNDAEFKNIQRSFFEASVVDIEMVSDHATRAATYRFANENGIKHLLKGNNFVSEGIMPPSWSHNKMDLMNIKEIHRRYGKIPLKNYSTMDYFKFLYYTFARGIKTVRVLNYLDYNVETAKRILIKEVGWEGYGLKHCESLFTKFFQCHVLPTKFDIDKRHSHFSALICSGQISRKMALEKLEQPMYEAHDLELATEYMLDAWGLYREDYDHIMTLPLVQHDVFDTFDMNSRGISFLRHMKRLLEWVGVKF